MRVLVGVRARPSGRLPAPVPRQGTTRPVHAANGILVPALLDSLLGDVLQDERMFVGLVEGKAFVQALVLRMNAGGVQRLSQLSEKRVLVALAFGS